MQFEQVRLVNPGLLDLRGIDARGRSLAECAYEIIKTVRPDIRTRIHLQYVRKKMDRDAPTYSIAAIEIRSGPKRRDKLPERDILRLTVLQACFVEVMEDTLDEWIDSSCRDLNYEREIRVWERMAACYLRSLSGRHYSNDIKRDIFGILLSLFSGASASELRKGFAAFQKEWAPDCTKFWNIGSRSGGPL